MEEADKQKLIKRYIDKDLGDKELTQFKILIETNPEFEEMVDLAVYIHAKKKIEQKEHLKKLAEEKAAQNTENQPWLKVFGSFMVLGIVALLVIGKWNASPEVHANHFLEDRLPINETMGESDNKIWLTAKKLYNENKYEEAIPLFAKIEGLKPEYQLLLGSSLLYMGKPRFRTAQKRFEKLLETSNPYEAEAWWQLSLIYLKTQEPEKAKPLLDQIIKKESWNFKRAKILRKGLKDN